ncbi:hypothetical protein ACNASG_13850 [Klebsiella pneumoniae]|uniref:hypothetical protein n=1 Tax=Klebsiella pneumoniae complex TaxID=3390273 RepID=UPI000E2B5600|nr:MULTISPECIES: hypothetical protein [Klebsiella]EKZ5545794.1 hypothetical protein [Klebsiella pneumoniae]MBC4127857.1 hypothetical protein [Klebsiella pneumoniae]MBL2619794.1 hypothetical protein [Klebsiella pneumoniae]MBL2647699.1 hypothetical protein [Klebsiella pneumoniae]MCJ4737370.1 hypothetical protein [Klebsiella pneumoniae]
MNTMTAVSFTLATIISSTGATVTNAASMPAAYVAGNFKQVERRSVQPRATSRGGSLQSYLRFAVSFKQMVTAIQRENSKMDTAIDEALTALEAGEEIIISDEVELLAATGVKFANAGIEVCVQAFDKALENANANAREAKQLTELRELSIETLMGVITSMNKVTELKKKAASNRPEPTLVIDLPRMEMALSSESIQIEKKLSRQEIRDLLSA